MLGTVNQETEITLGPDTKRLGKILHWHVMAMGQNTPQTNWKKRFFKENRIS
jgi:hypothetical protein